MKLCVSIFDRFVMDTPDLLYQSYECAAEALKISLQPWNGSDI